MKKTLSIFLFFVLPQIFSFAGHFQAADRITLDDPVYDDFYATAGEINIHAGIRGDFVGAGGRITINDTIRGDLTIAGGEIQINGYIGDDIRIAGGNVRLLQTVGGDLIICGGAVTLDRGSIIYGDVIVCGGSVEINGIVLGRVLCYGRNFLLGGRIESTAEIYAEKIELNGSIAGKTQLAAKTISIGENAQFFSDMSYWQENKTPDFKNSFKSGKPVFDSHLEAKRNFGWKGFEFNFLKMSLIMVLSGLLIILILVLVCKDTLLKAGEKMKDNLMSSFGYGVLYFIALPLLGAFLCMTIIGIPLGILLFCIFGFSIWFGRVIVAVTLGNLIQHKLKLKSGKLMLFTVTAVCYLLLWGITMLPFIGWLVLIVSVAGVFGGLVGVAVGWGKREV
ncbi:MAG: hypothetical protein A3H98_03150 [Bacteroidetes bacterium RIFCSPLOWO2_02_FULL_36_8]|nr:MAG: hypothetical protein A3H98_03150 [Bacteroidetes bacterium RIFCSPLOWO2_02_FULL_36_8]OFY70353.1 MAG: hypothetical protein A3G23_09480 [Bacteroidetes bacterium RIFCSPLOWO2_12_FULL_37_12]